MINPEMGSSEPKGEIPPEGSIENEDKIKIESVEEGTKAAQELIDDMLRSFPDAKDLTNKFSSEMKHDRLTEALYVSQQMSMLLDLKLLKERMEKDLKKYPDASFHMPDDDVLKRLDDHMRTPYNIGRQDMDMLDRIRDLTEVTKQTREISDPETIQSNKDQEELKSTREQIDSAFDGK